MAFDYTNQAANNISGEYLPFFDPYAANYANPQTGDLVGSTGAVANPALTSGTSDVNPATGNVDQSGTVADRLGAAPPVGAPPGTPGTPAPGSSPVPTAAPTAGNPGDVSGVLALYQKWMADPGNADLGAQLTAAVQAAQVSIKSALSSGTAPAVPLTPEQQAAETASAVRDAHAAWQDKASTAYSAAQDAQTAAATHVSALQDHISKMQGLVDTNQKAGNTAALATDTGTLNSLKAQLATAQTAASANIGVAPRGNFSPSPDALAARATRVPRSTVRPRGPNGELLPENGPGRAGTVSVAGTLPAISGNPADGTSGGLATQKPPAISGNPAAGTSGGLATVKVAGT